MHEGLASTDFSFPGQTDLYHGKVRDVYSIGNEYLVAVATDRISAFDVILPRPIPYKGQVLNQTAAYFLQQTEDIVPNWLVTMPDPNVSLGRKLETFAIEVVVRAALVGHAWREYESGKRELCGVALPDGLKEFDRLPEAIITPATKASEGHDEDISREEIINRGLASEVELANIYEIALRLFARGQELAQKQGLFLADTKYEFGKDDQQIYLIDEVHTPDSSRYFYKDGYEAYISGSSTEAPQHLSKEFVREWLMDRGFSGQAGAEPPEMDDDFVKSVSERYVELYEHVTGRSFEPADAGDIEKRIETNVLQALKEL